jgi:uncharacterized protein with PIN domain
LLHQATRELSADGRVVASIEDYRTVRALVADLVADGVGTTVSPTMRETVAAVGAQAHNGAEANITAVAKVLKLDKSAVQRRVRAAIDRGYVRNLEERRGRPARLVLGDALPDDQELLPTAERLQGCSEEGGVPAPPSPAAVAVGRVAAVRDDTLGPMPPTDPRQRDRDQMQRGEL